jgi:hypothetical protein
MKPSRRRLWRAMPDLAAEPATLKDLVLGLAIGYSADQLRPFVLSLKKTDFAGDLVLIISKSETDPDSIRQLEEWGARLVYYEGWRFMPMAVHCVRYSKYFEFLSQNEYGYILLTDTRDVIFQSDPMAIDKSKELYFFAEDKAATIGSCLSNSQWMKSAFGTETFARHYNKIICCSGTTMGSYSGIMRYLIATLEIIGMVNPAALLAAGIDQGIHNVIIHEQIIRDFHLMENQKHIATMCYIAKDGVRMLADGTIENADGTVSPIVHQYDYPPHEDINKKILQRYAG